MECKKMEKKLQNWARGLSFKLADGSAPPANYFTLLTATPHRRQLWETLIESIQPRKKVEHMRKQILVAKLTSGKKISPKNNLPIVTDRVDLWHKQNELENKLKNKKNESVKLEMSIILKASDLLFEICKVSEIEKVYEECSESELALRLFSRREKKVMEGLEKFLVKAMQTIGNFPETFLAENKVDHLRNELFNVKECKNPFDDVHCCELDEKLKELCDSGVITEQSLWEIVIKWKKNILEKFSVFLNDLNSNEKMLLSEKESQIEKNIYFSVNQLKQKVMEKSLEVILNSSEGQCLDYQIERLKETLLDGSEDGEKRKISLSEIFNESISPIEQNLSGDSLLAEREMNVADVMSVMKVLGLKSYYSFLKEKCQNFEEEEEKVKREKENGEKVFDASEEDSQLIRNTIEEICWKKNIEKNLSREIIRSHETLAKVLHSCVEEEEQKKKMAALENAHSLKKCSGRLIQVVADTPIDAFRIVETSEVKKRMGMKKFMSVHSSRYWLPGALDAMEIYPEASVAREHPTHVIPKASPIGPIRLKSGGRLLFELESFAHCLNNYGGELKQFFSAMLIPPEENSGAIFSEIERRQRILGELSKIIRCRGELSRKQKKMQLQISSIKWDKQLCERNFCESDAMLWNAHAKAEEIPSKIVFIEKILRNWIEQPYRLIGNC